MRIAVFCSDFLYRINRNIVECKGRKIPPISLPLNCINRNIVECKDDMWGGDGFSLICINRNIVECKERQRKPHGIYSLVLIETLWNVKLCHILEVVGLQVLVLIETLWNVKISNQAKLVILCEY